jgi:integrase
MNSFYERFLQLSDERSPLCLGLDPSRALMRDWGLSDDAEGLHRFCGVVMEAAADRIAVVKPQSGFFERLGPPGLSELARAVATIRGTAKLTRTVPPQANAYAMIRRRAAAAGIATKLGNHSFRATGITAYLKNGGTLEKAATMANRASTRTTQLYDRRRDELSLDEVERIVI